MSTCIGGLVVVEQSNELILRRTYVDSVWRTGFFALMTVCSVLTAFQALWSPVWFGEMLLWEVGIESGAFVAVSTSISLVLFFVLLGTWGTREVYLAFKYLKNPVVFDKDNDAVVVCGQKLRTLSSISSIQVQRDYDPQSVGFYMTIQPKENHPLLEDYLRCSDPNALGARIAEFNGCAYHASGTSS